MAGHVYRSTQTPHHPTLTEEPIVTTPRTYTRPTTLLTSASAYVTGPEGIVCTTEEPVLGQWVVERRSAITHLIVNGTSVCGDEFQYALLTGGWAVDGGRTACHTCRVHQVGSVTARDRSGLFTTYATVVQVSYLEWDWSDEPSVAEWDEAHPVETAWTALLAAAKVYAEAVTRRDPSPYPTEAHAIELIMAGLGDYVETGTPLPTPRSQA